MPSNEIGRLGDDLVSLYHFQEGFQSLANSKDLYLTVDSGLRFKVWGGLVSGLQWTMRYNKNPPPGVSDTDNLYRSRWIRLRHQPKTVGESGGGT